jgi:glycosyltransferase involved in cell wall biosynthesis
MKVLKTITVTDANLTSSTVPETDYAAWNSGTTYALNDRVILTSTHKIYSSLQAGNLNHDPTLDTQNDPDVLPVWWIEVNSTNRWRPFDGQRSNVATDASPMTYVITPDVVTDAVALLNADAEMVNVTVTFDAIEVYNSDFQMVSRVVSDWYEFFFKPFQQKRNIYIDGLPPLIGSEVNVTLTRDSGNVSLGILAIGNSLFIGDAVWGAESDIRSFSRNEPNDFGVTRLVRRTPKVLTRQRVMTNPALTTFLYELREELESVISVWSTIDDVDSELFNAYILNGIADRFVINATDNAFTNVQLELREI